MRRVAQLPMIFSAVFLSPFPRLIPQRGVPPEPANAANAVTRVRMGKHIPSPVSALEPEPGMCPIYILSITLYKRLIS